MSEHPLHETQATLEPGPRALLAELEGHHPVDDVERAHLRAIVALLRSEPACFARTTFSPGHVTGSAFVLDPSGRLLLHHHRRLDRWLQLGGHDEGEASAARTALREAQEESGLTDLVQLGEGVLDVDVHLIPEGKREPAHLHHDVRYAFLTRTPDAIVIDEAESRSLAFFTLDEAAQRLPDAARVFPKLARLLRPS